MRLILEQKILIKNITQILVILYIIYQHSKILGWLKCLWTAFSLDFIQKDDFFIVLWQAFFEKKQKWCIWLLTDI